jgi:hypothetical protein
VLTMPFTNLILMMTDLSPAAQAVLKAYYSTAYAPAAPALAAALRAAVHQLNNKRRWEPGVHWVRMELLAMADELEGRNEATL